MLKKHIMTWLASVMVLVTVTIPVSNRTSPHQTYRPLQQEQTMIGTSQGLGAAQASTPVANGESNVPQNAQLSQEAANVIAAAPAASTPSTAQAADSSESSSMRALDFGNLTHPGPDGSKTGHPRVYFLCYVNRHWKTMLLHIPKNAGSSVAENLADILCAGTENATCHSKEERMAHFKMDDKCAGGDQSYFTFAFTRNPWARAVSFWSYGLKRKQLSVKDLAKRRQLAARYCSFRQFLFNKGGAGCGHHAEYEQYPLIYDAKGRPGLNFLGRVEHFERDFQEILKRIDPTGKLLEIYRKRGFVMHNDSGHKPYQDYFTDEQMKQQVAAKWPQDVRALGYTFNFTGSKMNIAAYADGKAAAELMFGDVAA